MKRGEARQTGSRGLKAAGGSKAARSDLIGEITKNSSHLLAVQANVETQGDFVRTLATEVREATFTNIEDVVAFVSWLDEELSFLVDEGAVLKHFDWPEKRADALQDVAAKHQGLVQLEKQVSSFVDDRVLHRDAALGKMYSLFEKYRPSSRPGLIAVFRYLQVLIKNSRSDMRCTESLSRIPLFLFRTEKSIYKFLQDRDAADAKNSLVSRYKEQDIPVGWMSEAGLVAKGLHRQKLLCT